ncbi:MULTISPECIES: TetR/AcrR family transcriptional regulator [unclassified Rhizobium]|uniref:TetR/AcrR family transcriptional regulator n=1 Tax=unclassified Rhizobium TaxID=2613769 RepID=UPI00288BF009|nr:MULTISPECIES: TetR/AcrR family transcriptional regulator [unclassified Rhizobium]
MSRRPTETTPDNLREENITKILDAADRTFRHFGYGKTTVADIASDLGMSTANIYRFFASKVEIHQALCARMLQVCRDCVQDVRNMPSSAESRLREFVRVHHEWTLETMLDQSKVHEMIIVAIERDWPVFETHIDLLQGIVSEIIEEGVAAGEFPEQDHVLASRCFGAATVTLCHPQVVSQGFYKKHRASVDDITDFAISALKNATPRNPVA